MCTGLNWTRLLGGNEALLKTEYLRHINEPVVVFPSTQKSFNSPAWTAVSTKTVLLFGVLFSQCFISSVCDLRDSDVFFWYSLKWRLYFKNSHFCATDETKKTADENQCGSMSRLTLLELLLGTIIFPSCFLRYHHSLRFDWCFFFLFAPSSSAVE